MKPRASGGYGPPSRAAKALQERRHISEFSRARINMQGITTFGGLGCHHAWI